MLPRLLIDDRFRSHIIAHHVGDPVVRAFWLTEYAVYGPSFRTEAISPIQNKIGKVLIEPRLDPAGRAQRYARVFRTSQRSAARLIVAGAARRQGPHRSRSLRRPSQTLAPLTARLVARPCWRASRSSAPGQVEIISSIRTDRMPPRRNCGHKGADHDWTTPPCVREARVHWRCHCAIEHPQQLRGRCFFPVAGLTTYVPDTDSRKPVSSVIGRFLRARRR
jgi:hypothetical protein